MLRNALIRGTWIGGPESLLIVVHVLTVVAILLTFTEHQEDILLSFLNDAPFSMINLNDRGCPLLLRKNSSLLTRST